MTGLETLPDSRVCCLLISWVVSGVSETEMKKIPCSILTWFSRLNRGWRTIVFFTAGHDSFTFLVIYAWPVLTLSVSGLSSWSPWSLFTEVKEESVSCSLFPLESLPMTQQRQRQKEQKDYFLLKWPPAVVVAETRRWQWLSSLEWHFSLTRESVEKDFAILYFMQSILLSHIYFVFERLTLIPSLIGSKTEFREEEGRVKFWRWWGNKRRKETCHITPLISCVHWFWVLLLNLFSHTRHVILLCPLVSSLVFSISSLIISRVHCVSETHDSDPPSLVLSWVFHELFLCSAVSCLLISFSFFLSLSLDWQIHFWQQPLSIQQNLRGISCKEGHHGRDLFFVFCRHCHCMIWFWEKISFRVSGRRFNLEYRQGRDSFSFVFPLHLLHSKLQERQ